MTVKDRFLKYVQIDTEADPNSKTFPSSMKQKNLGKVLYDELIEIGLTDVEFDDYGYVYATIPSNVDKDVPVICFCSHMDTSPDSSGKDVKPIVHENYQGQDLILPDDPSVVLKMNKHRDLKDQIGNDVITASGLTLLGADNKAGLAEIVSATKILVDNPDLKHGKIRLLFTPDEEIGRGVDHVDMEKLAADFGYTIDGERAGTFEDETFSADMVKITIHGVSAHPGFAKGKMESAIKAMSAFMFSLPSDFMTPEATSGKEGFVHPVRFEGSVESSSAIFIIRDFITAELKNKEEHLENLLKKALKHYPNCTYDFEISEQYRNMKEILDQHPEVVENVLVALKRSGFEQPEKRSIRGGTDGSRLSFMGLPCPNIFTGGHAFHSRQEWVSVQDMEKAVETIVNLAQVWAE